MQAVGTNGNSGGLGGGPGGGHAEVHVPLSSYIPCFLQTTLVKGTELRSSKININGKGDPFVILQILKGDHPDPSKGVRSRIIRNTMEPVWNDNFQFNDVNTASDKLALMAYDFTRVGKNPPLGQAIIPLSDLVKNVPKELTVKLADAPKAKKHKERGSLHIILTATDNERDEHPVIREGYLKKEGGLKMSKSLVWQNRYLIIRPGLVTYKEFKVSTNLKGSIKDLNNCKVYTTEAKDGAKIRSKNNYYFNVKSPDRTYKFKVNSNEERQEWIAALVKAGCVQEAHHHSKHKDDTLHDGAKFLGKVADKAVDGAGELRDGLDKHNVNDKLHDVGHAVKDKVGSPPKISNPLDDHSPPKFKSALTEALKASRDELSSSSSSSSSSPPRTARGTLSEPKLTVFVTGALGNCGFSAVKELVNRKKKTTQVKAGVRSAARAEELKGLDVEVVEIDADRIDTLVSAFQGVDRLFIIPTSAQNRVEHVKNYVAAAKKANIKHVVLLSLFVAGAVRPEHKSILFSREFKEMEDSLEHSGLSWTRLRATFFIQNFFGFQDAISRGVLALPIGEGAFSPLDLDDLTRLASMILLKNDTDVRVYSGKTYILTGPQSLDGVTLAREITRGIAAGRPREENERNPVEVKYISSTMEQWRQAAMEMGYPEWHANGLFELLQIFARNEADFVSSDYQNLTGQEPNSIANFFRDNCSAFT